MSTVLAEEASAAQPVVVLSGPSFAAEVAQGLPTALLSAFESCSRGCLRSGMVSGSGAPAASDDVPGVEIGGAMKNVIAIAAGVVEGLGGHNAMAALITRDGRTISRLADAEGGVAKRSRV